MIIRARNLLDQKAAYTYLSNTEAVGVGTVRVKNIDGASANWAIQLGKTGEEQTEIGVISASAPSGTSLIITGTTRFEHPADTPVYFIKWDKLIFKRSTSGTAGTATAMTNGTVSITPDSLFTQFDDTTGATTYAYKVSYYNSVTAEESSNSDWITPAGFSFYSLAKMRERTKDKLVSANYIKNDSLIDDWLNEWGELMNNAAVDVNQDYALGTVDIAFGTAGYGTITTSNFKEIRRFETTYNGTDFYLSTKMSQTAYTPQEVFNSTHPYFVYLGDNIFQVKPAESGGTARLIYYKLYAPLVNDADELPVSMKGYTNSFVDYALSQAYYLDGKVTEGQLYGDRAEALLQRFKADITPRSKGGPVYVTLVEPISSDDTIEYL